MNIITYQPTLRQALPNIYGPLENREERAMYERVDTILAVSGNEQFTALLAAGAPLTGLPGESPAMSFGLPAAITCDEVIFDSTCLKANIHFPVDWVLLHDAARTLMKALELRIARHARAHLEIVRTRRDETYLTPSLAWGDA